MKLEKIHRIVRFKQRTAIKPFIEKCTEMRMKAPTKTLQEMWKLLANSAFGKLIENHQNRMDCKFETSAAILQEHAASPLYKSTMICSEGLSVSFMKKPAVDMRQVWAVGFSILEISKYIMQKLWYQHIVPAFGWKNLHMIFSDTDSFCYSVKGRSPDEVRHALKDVMDFSNLPKHHPLYSEERKKRPGFLKDETPDRIVKEVVAVKSKTHASKTGRSLEEDEEGEEEDSKVDIAAKGVKKYEKRKIPFKKFVDCIRDVQEVNVSQYSIQARDHVNRLIRSKKVAFNSFDDKRYAFCLIHTAPFGSALIERFERDRRCPYCE